MTLTLTDWIESITREPEDYRDGIAMFADWLEEREDIRHERLRWWHEVDLRLRCLPAVSTASLRPTFTVRMANGFMRTLGRNFKYDSTVRFLTAAARVMPPHRTSRPRPETLLLDRIGDLRVGYVRLDQFLTRVMLAQCGLGSGADALPRREHRTEREVHRVAVMQLNKDMQDEAASRTRGGFTLPTSFQRSAACARHLYMAVHVNASVFSRVLHLRRLIATVNGYDPDDVNCRCSLAAVRWLVAGVEVCADLLERS